MPTIKYNFVSLDELEKLNKDAICGTPYRLVTINRSVLKEDCRRYRHCERNRGPH